MKFGIQPIISLCLLPALYFYFVFYTILKLKTHTHTHKVFNHFSFCFELNDSIKIDILLDDAHGIGMKNDEKFRSYFGSH